MKANYLSILFLSVIAIVTQGCHKKVTEEIQDTTGNPVIEGFFADPEILYSNQTGLFYLYPTTDGTPGWGGHTFNVFSSPDLKEWKKDTCILDLATEDVKWATGNAWAPAIIEKKDSSGNYKYYFYFSGHDPELKRKAIGVAIADSPTGPFLSTDSPIISQSPVGHGQEIDVDVFQDPETGKFYLYWGNGYMAGAELNPDMVSINEETLQVMTPEGGTLQDYEYREAPYVFFRNGKYYFLWSVDDTGSPNYHVAYGTSDSPLGRIEVAENQVILSQNPENEIYGPAHCSVICLPDKDEWFIVYHRINKNFLTNEPGVHREICIDTLEFNEDGSIKPVVPTK